MVLVFLLQNNRKLKYRIMGLIGGIVGAGASLLGGALAAKKANKGYNDAISAMENRMSEVKAHRDALYYQDPTQSAENQAAVSQAQKVLDEQTKRTAGANVVSGGTDESVAMQKRAASEAVGQMMQQQAASGASRRDQIWGNADSQLNAMNNYIATAKMNKGLSQAQAIQQAAAGVANAAQGMNFGTSKIGNKGFEIDW